jgi:tetratricopeptide (TPR) repeat protein
MLLVNGTSDAPERQRTLQATLDWSFDLLGEPEQRLLEHLSVFAGGATLDAIAAVHDDKPVSSVRLLELVRHLLEASLLKPAGGVAGHPRWTMLETVREYASERLRRRPEAAQVHARHAAYFAALLQRPDHNLWSFRPSPALARVEPELDNVRTALAWAHDHRQVDMGLRLVWSLVPLVDRRGHPRELLEWGEDFLALDDPHARGPSKKRARALCATAYCAMFTGQLDRGIALAQAAETEFRAIRPIDDAPAAESLDTAAMPVYLRAYVAWFSGQPEAADALAGEAVALARRTGARRVVAWALLVRGIVSGHQGRFAAAQAYLDEARALASAPADESILTRIDIALGALLCRQQASGRAISLYREAQEIGGEPEDNMVAQLVLDGLARVAYLEGQPEDAARLLGAADARYEALGVQWPRHPYEPPPSHERFVAQVRAVLGDLRFTELAATGRGLSVGAALALVHAEPV